MKSVYKLIGIILVFALLGSVFAGCGLIENPQPPIALAIVIGNSANRTALTDKHFESIRPLVERAVYGGTVAVIIADGAPHVVEIQDENGAPLDFKLDAKSKPVLERRIATYSDAVMDFLKSDATKATTPEVDLLGSIKEAERLLHDISGMEKHIAIIDSGVSTAGRVDLNSFHLDTTDIPAFVKGLSQTDGILPDLTGIHVLFVGLGDVAHPQVLPDTTLPKLQKLWQEILTACGILESDLHFAVSARGTIANMYTEEAGGFPYVSVVDFIPVVLDTVENLETHSAELLLPNVGFEPDSANFLDEEKAERLLLPYAESMVAFFNENPDEKLYLVGTTARTTPDAPGNIALSQSRAEKLCTLLVDNGVPKEGLVVLGVGANVPEHLRIDEFASGAFDSVLAQANRKATVYEKNNPNFLAILAHNGIAIP